MQRSSLIHAWISNVYYSSPHITVGVWWLFREWWYSFLGQRSPINWYFSLEVKFRGCFLHWNSLISFRNKLFILGLHPGTSLFFIVLKRAVNDISDWKNQMLYIIFFHKCFKTRSPMCCYETCNSDSYNLWTHSIHSKYFTIYIC